MIKFGKVFVLVREINNLTRKQLAEVLDTDENHIRRIEYNVISPSDKIWNRLVGTYSINEAVTQAIMLGLRHKSDAEVIYLARLLAQMLK